MSSPPARKASSSPGGTSTPPTDTGLLPPQHWTQPAENLEDEDDGDSGLVDNVSTTVSLTSSILQYRTIHGRTYHSDSANTEYWGPIDNTHQEAMDINHHVLTLLLDDKLYLAPISKDIQAAVDIGTGTGIWAIDFADEFPNTSVIGTDISPIQPGWVPPNLQFQIDDCTQEWTFKDNSLDYVHMRWLAGSIADWTALFQAAYRCLKPGGYLETYEPSSCIKSDDGTVLESSALCQWGKFFVEGGRKLGRSFELFEEGTQKLAMEEAGFVEIEERNFKNPVGRWPKDEVAKQIGSFMQLAFEQDAEGAVLFMATLCGWTKEEVTVFLAHFRREIRSKAIHGFFEQKVVWGRKPMLS